MRVCLCLSVAFVSLWAGAEEIQIRDHQTGASPWFRTKATESVFYARGNPFDVKHTKIEIAVDPEEESIRGKVTHTLSPTGKPMDEIRLDSVGLDIESVELDGKRVADFEVTDDALNIFLAKAIKPGRDVALTVHYSGVGMESGLSFKTEKMGYSPEDVQAWSQGEDEYSRYWFPCFDYPNDRVTSEMIVTVPEGFMGLSNGRHVSTTQNPGEGTSTWHWSLETSHVAYLIDLVVGRFVEVKDLSGPVPLYYYVSPREEENVARSYVETQAMMSFFAEYLDLPYAYGRYSQVSAVEFGGGMENTSITTMTEGITFDEASGLISDYAGLIAHELAHQWFGNLITCRDWSHLWLNEGFATYSETLYTEYAHGADRADYDRYTGDLKGILRADRGDNRAPTVRSNYEDPGDLFSPRIYAKGGCILHMLRTEMGDDLFQKGIQTYAKRFQGKVVETNDLMRVMEEVSGLGLEQFFDQWLYHGGYPKLKVTYKWNQKASQAEVTVTQTQKVDVTTPLFAFNTKLYFKGKGFEHNEPISISGKDHAFQIKLKAKPDFMVVDPNAIILAEWDYKQPKEMLLAQLKDSPFVVDRVRALEALTKEKGEKVVQAVGHVLKTAKFYPLRIEAVKVLARMKEDSARDILHKALAKEKDAHVRNALARALSTAKQPEIRQSLLDLITDDPSPHVVATAIQGFASQRWDGALTVITEAVHRDSHNDRIRGAALRALGTFKKEESLDAVLPYVAGTPDQRRIVGQAIRTAGAIGSRMDDKSIVREALLRALDNPRPRTRTAAMSALGVLGDHEAIEALEAFAHTSKEENEQKAARSAIKAINDQDAQSTAVKELREAVQEVTEDRDDLLKRLEKLEESLGEEDDDKAQKNRRARRKKSRTTKD